jgi:3-mercaptopyruvate sulfurtransferase SseA
MGILRRRRSQLEDAPADLRQAEDDESLVHEPTDHSGLDAPRTLVDSGSIGACCGPARYVAAADGALSAAEELAGWFAPRAPRARKVQVPNFVGMRASKTFYVSAQAGVKTSFVELSSNPAPVDGLIVQQEPSPGTTVKRDAIVILGVTHERN